MRVVLHGKVIVFITCKRPVMKEAMIGAFTSLTWVWVNILYLYCGHSNIMGGNLPRNVILFFFFMPTSYLAIKNLWFYYKNL